MNIKVVQKSDPDKFEEAVNDLFKEGYKLSSSYCGFVQSESYDFCSSYHAILIKEI